MLRHPFICAAFVACAVTTAACARRVHDAQRQGENAIAALRARTIPLDSADSPTDTDLAPLDTLLAGVPLVLVGEPQHGAHEPLAMRNRIIRRLVSHGQLTAVALESGLTESEAVARYVTGGPNALNADSVSAAARYLTWGFARFAENVELLRWLRAWNDDPAHARKVRFYGFDLSLGGPALISPKPIPIEEALAWLEDRDASSARRLREEFAPFLPLLPTNTAALDKSARATLGRTIDSLVATVRRTPAAPSADGEQRKVWALRKAIAAQQAHAMMLVVSSHDEKGMPPNAWRAINARDSAMAENVRWVMEREGANGRVLAFAHDDHVKRVASQGGDFEALEQQPRMMGTYLDRSLGSRMAVIGMSYGDSNTVTGTKGVANLDSALALVRRPPYLLSLRARGEATGAADAWLSRRWAMRVNSDTFVLLAPNKAFDYLVVLGGVSKAQ